MTTHIMNPIVGVVNNLELSIEYSRYESNHESLGKSSLEEWLRIPECKRVFILTNLEV